ncbi:MAG: hypothetical protein GC166_13565 [Alphaproteobacteria bacterium]|nr:hypothetical protein [Alphaproteobacteria bacterium]
MCTVSEGRPRTGNMRSHAPETRDYL